MISHRHRRLLRPWRGFQLAKWRPKISQFPAERRCWCSKRDSHSEWRRVTPSFIKKNVYLNCQYSQINWLKLVNQTLVQLVKLMWSLTQSLLTRANYLHLGIRYWLKGSKTNRPFQNLFLRLQRLTLSRLWNHTY